METIRRRTLLSFLAICTVITLNVFVVFFIHGVKSYKSQVTYYYNTKIHSIYDSRLDESNVEYAVLEVTLTAYTPEVNQCDDDPLITASMKRVKLGGVAVSPDLFRKGYTFGRKIYIRNLGIFTVTDLMNSRYTNSIDIFMWDKSKAVAFGKRKGEVSLTDMYR